MLNIDCMEEGTMVIDWDPAAYKTKGGSGKGIVQSVVRLVP